MRWLWQQAHKSDTAVIERLEEVACHLEEVTIEVRERIEQIRAGEISVPVLPPEEGPRRD